MVRSLGRVTGHLDYYLFRARAERIKSNLVNAFQNALSEKAATEIVKKVLSNHYALILEFFKYPQINRSNFERIIEIVGLENLEEALSLKRGVLIGHGHFGSRFILILALGLKGYPINQIAYIMTKEELTFIRERVSLKQRLKIEKGLPVKYIYRGESMREAFSCLERNEILMVAIEGEGEFKIAHRSAVQVNFLGQPTYWQRGIAAFAKRRKTPVLPASVIRQASGNYTLVIHPAITLNYDRPPEEFNIEVIGRLTQFLEKDIRRYPDQWEYWEEFTPADLQNGKKE
jgi:KDO2-lipid IV(A) lauroyltransferase